MNLCLESAVFIDQKGLQYRLDNFAVRPRQISYVQLPNDVSQQSSHIISALVNCCRCSRECFRECQGPQVTSPTSEIEKDRGKITQNISDKPVSAFFSDDFADISSSTHIERVNFQRASNDANQHKTKDSSYPIRYRGESEKRERIKECLYRRKKIFREE